MYHSLGSNTIWETEVFVIKSLFNGVGTALVTPFSDGKVDYESFERNVRFQCDNGIDAIIVCGTTGEAPTLSDDEHICIIKRAVKAAKGNMQVIAGTGSNCTEHAVYMSKAAYEAGADGILSVTPYYNKCNKEGMYLHYKSIAQSVPIPIILYNVPSRTGVGIDIDTLKKLNEIENIAALKEASGNISFAAEAASVLNKMKIYSGCDDLTVPILSLGGKGVISVLSNIIPAEVKKMTDLFFSNKIVESSALQLKLMPLTKALFLQTNPIPVKYALYKLGMCKNELRLPLSPINTENAVKIEKELKNLNLF